MWKAIWTPLFLVLLAAVVFIASADRIPDPPAVSPHHTELSAHLDHQGGAAARDGQNWVHAALLNNVAWHAALDSALPHIPQLDLIGQVYLPTASDSSPPASC